MINKAQLLAKLEEERMFAAECHLPQMALGLLQAIKVVESTQEESLEIEIDFDEMEEIKFSLLQEDEEEV